MSRKILAICFDFGDTLADEATEVKDETGTTQKAELIPGAGETVRQLARRGYRLALVADGRPGTYRNVLSQHGLYDLFEAFAISEEVGVEKPDARMFVHALEQLGIEPEDYGRTIMVGNHLERDIKGANALGMISVWIDWAPRRSKTPRDESEVPQYTINMPVELIEVVERIEKDDGNFHHPISEYLRKLREKVGSDLILIPSVTVLVFDQAGRVLLVRHAEGDRWVAPGGSLEPGERPAGGAVREMWEETGLWVEPVRILGVYGGPEFQWTYANGDQVAYVMTVFEGRVRSGELRAGDEEVLELGYFSERELAPLPKAEWLSVVLEDVFANPGRANFRPPAWEPPR